MLTIGRAWLRAFLGPFVAACAVGSALTAVSAGLRILFEGGISLNIARWVLFSALAVPASMSVLLPAAALVGTVVVRRRWEEEGAWIGLRASGVRGADLLFPALVVGGLVAIGTAAGTLVVEPHARRTAAWLLADSLAAVELRPDAPVRVGDVHVLAAERAAGWSRDVVVFGEGFVGVVARARVGLAGGQPAIELVDGEVRGREGSWKVRWERWVRPLEVPSSRVELPQRSVEDLVGLIGRTERSGRGAEYERCVLWKRFLHPLAMLLVPLGVLPFAASRWRWVGAASVGLGYLVAVRLGDATVNGLGAWAGAVVGPLALLIVTGLVWLAWRER